MVFPASKFNFCEKNIFGGFSEQIYEKFEIFDKFQEKNENFNNLSISDAYWLEISQDLPLHNIQRHQNSFFGKKYFLGFFGPKSVKFGHFFDFLTPIFKHFIVVFGRKCKFSKFLLQKVSIQLVSTFCRRDFENFHFRPKTTMKSLKIRTKNQKNVQISRFWAQKIPKNICFQKKPFQSLQILGRGRS